MKDYKDTDENEMIVKSDKKAKRALKIFDRISKAQIISISLMKHKPVKRQREFFKKIMKQRRWLIKGYMQGLGFSDEQIKAALQQLDNIKKEGLKRFDEKIKQQTQRK